MRLTEASVGETVRLTHVYAGRGLQARLATLRLIPGVAVRVLNNSSWGPLIVAVADGRVVLGRGMAAQIEVERTPAASPAGGPAPVGNDTE